MAKRKIVWDDLADVLAAQDIADILSIGRRRVYELFDLNPMNGGIPNYRIGGSRRADKEDVRKWKEELKNKSRDSYVKGS